MVQIYIHIYKFLSFIMYICMYNLLFDYSSYNYDYYDLSLLITSFVLKIYQGNTMCNLI